MRTFALTYPQLMNQALAQGMEEETLGRLRSACELAEKEFNGFYRGQGTPFICHLVRAASIVLAERQPIEVVIATLLHAVYMRDGFQEGGHKKPTARQRTRLQQAVGPETERFVWRYREIPWGSSVHQHLAQLSTYGDEMHRVLVMRLANELEDYLDLGMGYRNRSRFLEEITTHGQQSIALARRLGLTQLARELQEAFETHLTCRLPEVLLRNRCYAYKRMNLLERVRARGIRLVRWIR